MDILEYLRGNRYPGRGIVLGRSEEGGRAVAIYFIMGRSENSRNRVFERTEDGIRTKAFDAARLTDPSLVIYRPVRVWDGRTVVTNGDQTDTIVEALQAGRGFHAAIMTRTFEPDAPLWTPRVSGLINPGGGYLLSIIKNIGGEAETPAHQMFEYSRPLPGVGHLIHTYQGDGNPPPSFAGEPAAVEIRVRDGLRGYAETVWNALDAENRVALYAREIVVATGEAIDVIINRHGKGA
jgi:IMP cyclohydrolase